MALTVSRHEIVKDGTGKPIRYIIGVTYTDDITGRQVYRDTVFSANEFTPTPTKAEIVAKVNEWLNKVPEFTYQRPGEPVQVTKGKSILQITKEEAQKIETMVSMKKGEPGSLIDEIIPEA